MNPESGLQEAASACWVQTHLVRQHGSGGLLLCWSPLPSDSSGCSSHAEVHLSEKSKHSSRLEQRELEQTQDDFNLLKMLKLFIDSVLSIHFIYRVKKKLTFWEDWFLKHPMEKPIFSKCLNFLLTLYMKWLDWMCKTNDSLTAL